MAQTTSIVQNDALIYQRDGEECSLVVGTPAWYAWLETVTVFTFSSAYGTFTAHKEQAGNRRGGRYWKAYRRRNGKLHRAYLGKSEELTLGRLNAIAAALAGESLTGKASGAQEPSLQARPASPMSADSAQSPTATPASATGSTYASGAMTSNLPAQLPPLLGREQDVARACGLLGQTGVRLLTFVGPGGVGKTRLALQVAAEMPHTFPGGVYLVSLAPINDPALVVPTIAQTLGLREVGSKSLLDRLKEYLHEKHLLLVLDNFEQVVTAAPLLAELLEEYPLLKLLVTSREALRLSYERLLPVTPLALPDLNHLPALEALSHYAAVTLFIQRVRAVKPDFQLTAVNARTVVEICVRLDGLPLAIELAAARIRLLSPQQLLTRLGRRLQVLTGGARDLPGRQQTLRDTIRWSYDLLNHEEKRLFRLLAVFVGGCTLEAAESVCQGIYRASAETVVNVLDAVISLLDKHLLQQREQEDREPRLFMLETIREYGVECLQVSGEMDAIRRAHAGYYLALAEEAEPRLFGEEQIAWFDRLEQEHENLRAALQWFMEREEPESALCMSGALVRFWSVRGYVSEGRKWLEGALAIGEHVEASIRAKALNGAGWLAFMRSDYERAEESCGAALNLFRELSNTRGAALSLHRLGQVASKRDNHARARALLEESLALYRRVNDKGGLAYSLMVLAGMLDSQVEAAQARALLEESLALFREARNKEGLAWSLWALGRVILSQGNLAMARSPLEEGLALFEELNLKEGTAQMLGLLGQASLQQGDSTMALLLINESLALARELGNRLYIGYALILLARVAATQGDISSARSYYEESLALFRELDDGQSIVLCLEELASLDAAREHTKAVQPTITYPAGLTAREVDVLRLVARGLTDAQVAGQLVLSPRTVNAHLRSIYSKLNVTSRTAATRYAVEHHFV